MGGITVEHETSFRCKTVYYGENLLGVCIGIFFTDLSSWEETIIQLAEQFEDPPDPVVLISQFSGSFVYFTSDAQIYPDPGATIPIVFHRSKPVAATTASQLFGPSDYFAHLDQGLFTALDVAHEGWFPAGLTAHKSVERLLPNHCLDLRSRRQARFWPEGPIPRVRTVEECLGGIVEALGRYVGVLAEHYPLRCCLTAGRDSRAVLASAYYSLANSDFFTLAVDQALADPTIASRIAASLGLRHEIVTPERSKPADVERWLYANGHAVGGINKDVFRFLYQFGPGSVVVTGNGGEIGRGFFYRSGDSPKSKLSGTNLVARLGLPQVPSIVTRVVDWIRSLVDLGLPFDQILDLAYIELRLGPWAFAKVHLGGTPYVLNPIVQRSVVEGLLSLPFEYKRMDLWPVDVVRLMRPELLRFPFNRSGGIRDLIDFSKKVFSVRRWKRYLRKKVLH